MKLFTKRNQIKYTLFFSIFLSIIILYGIFVYVKNNIAVNVPKHILSNILTPGKYKGTGYYSPTDHYPDGLKTKLFMNITKHDSQTISVVNVDAYNAKTGKLEYSGVRKSNFDYKPNHDLNVFKNSNSYIDNKLVSSSHGKVIKASNNSIVIRSDGSWHTSSHEHDIINKIEKKEDKVYSTFYNTGIIPFYQNHTMKETYTKI